MRLHEEQSGLISQHLRSHLLIIHEMRQVREYYLYHEHEMERVYDFTLRHMHSVQTDQVDEHGHQEIHTAYRQQMILHLLQSEPR